MHVTSEAWPSKTITSEAGITQGEVVELVEMSTASISMGSGPIDHNQLMTNTSESR